MSKDWRGRPINTVPSSGNVAPNLAPESGGLGTELSLKQGFSPDDQQFVDYLVGQGFQDLGRQSGGAWYVQGPDGKTYDIFSRDDILLRNFPDIAITGLAAASGVGLGSRLAGPGILRWLGRVLGTSAVEGGLNVSGEAARQGAGIAMGVGNEPDEAKLDMALRAGLVSGALPGMAGGLLEGTAALGRRVSLLPEELASAVRSTPGLLKSSTKKGVEAAETGFNQRLADQSKKLIGDEAKAKAESLSSSQIMYSPQELLEMLSVAEMKTARPLGGVDPLAPIKGELKSMMASKRHLPLVDAKGNPLIETIPETPVSPEVVAATKQALQDMGFPGLLEKSSFREGVSGKASSAMRTAEDAALDIEGQIARDRLAAINRLREDYPTLGKAMASNKEGIAKDKLFKPTLEDPLDDALKELDLLSKDIEGLSPLLPEYQRIMLQKRIQQANKLRSSETGGSLWGPMIGGAAGTMGGPGGTALGTALGAGIQSPAVNLQLQNFLGYLDRLGVKRGAKVGAGARDAALMELIEGD
jgi:hypothetical protein